MNKRDPINKNVEMTWFFYVKRVLTFEDQFDKYLITLLYAYVPPFNWIIPWIFVTNIFFFFTDLFGNLTVNTREKSSYYPSMYTNLLAWLFVNQVNP